MKITHDLHIHTNISSCGDETATLENYLANAKHLGLTKLGFADHIWDSAVPGAPRWYQPQNLAHVLPLKERLRAESEKQEITLYFGCETEYDFTHRDVALTEEAAEQFDYILVPNSHTHLAMPKDFYEPCQRHADFMVQAYEDILNSKISRCITAIAHPFHAVNCKLYDYKLLFDLISDDQFKRLFDQTAEKGIAVEINVSCLNRNTAEELLAIPEMRMFAIAKERGCKFTFGSDAHRPEDQDNYQRSELIAELLGLRESDLAKIAR